MWELFKEQYHGELVVRYNLYYAVFTEEFNIGFGSPKTDVCSFCTGHVAKIRLETDENRRKELVTELLIHRTRARKFYNLLATKEDDSTLVLSFDLMQNQALPKSSIGEAYYARQLWLYILGIIEHKATGDRNKPGEQSRDDVHFYSWGEQEMGRGSNQVASALKDFLDRLLANAPGIKKVVLYSDSCIGQNKNFAVLGLLNMLATEHAIEIEHVFPVRGHSYMPADRAFGRVEKKLRRIEEILLPEQYFAEFAKVGHVHVHGQNWHAYDIKEAVDMSIKRPPPFKISEARKLKISPAPSPVKVCVHYSSPGTEFSILKRGKRWSAVQLGRTAVKSCVKPAKKTDVKKLLQALGFDVTEQTEEIPPCGPLTLSQRVQQFFLPICAATQDMEVDSDGDDATVTTYE